MQDASFERSLVNVTQRFREHFASIGQPNRLRYSPEVFYCPTDGCYYQYSPALCAADASLPRYQMIGLSFEAAVRNVW